MHSKESLVKKVQNIVEEAWHLQFKHTQMSHAPVNYACVFAQSDDEYHLWSIAAEQLGKVVKETPTGSVYQIEPLQTMAGDLQVVKIRKPDSTRPELGDADFTVSDYENFKKKYQNQKGFKVISRPDMEMIELVDASFNVRAYFSHPTLEKLLHINPI